MKSWQMKTWSVALYCIALCSTLVIGAGSEALAQAPRGATDLTVAHWGSERILIYMPFYVALDGGFFSRAGLNVHVLYSGNDDQVFATVASGRASVGISDPAFAGIARTKGGDGRIIAPLVTALTNWGVASRPNVRAINKAGDLRGLRVTSFPQPSTTYTVLRAIQDSLGPKSFSIVQTSFGSELAVVRRGDADIAMLLEPQTSLAEQAGYRVVWSLAKQYPPFMLTGISTTDKVIGSSRPQLVAFLRGLNSAFDFIRSDPDSAARIVQKSFPTVAPEIVKRAVRRLTSDGGVPRSVVAPLDGWNRVLSLRVAAGELSNLAIARSALDTTLAIEAIASPLSVAHASEASARSPADSTNKFWLWLGRVGDFGGVMVLVISAFGYFKWRTRVRLFQSKLSERDRRVAVVLSTLLAKPGERLSRARALSIVGQDNPTLAMHDVERSLSKLHDLGLIRVDKEWVTTDLDFIERQPILSLVLNRTHTVTGE